jgi:hypothetical protein
MSKKKESPIVAATPTDSKKARRTIYNNIKTPPVNDTNTTPPSNNLDTFRGSKESVDTKEVQELKQEKDEKDNRIRELEKQLAEMAKMKDEVSK